MLVSCNHARGEPPPTPCGWDRLQVADSVRAQSSQLSHVTAQPRTRMPASGNDHRDVPSRRVRQRLPFSFTATLLEGWRMLLRAKSAKVSKVKAYFWPLALPRSKARTTAHWARAPRSPRRGICSSRPSGRATANSASRSPMRPGQTGRSQSRAPAGHRTEGRRRFVWGWRGVLTVW